jgi:hypothetical protein
VFDDRIRTLVRPALIRTHRHDRPTYELRGYGDEAQEPASAVGIGPRCFVRPAPRKNMSKCVPLRTLVEAQAAGRRIEVV